MSSRDGRRIEVRFALPCEPGGGPLSWVRHRAHGRLQTPLSMSDIKFLCPSCGQRIQCDAGHVGLQIPCPGCSAQLKIPRLSEGNANTEILPKANLAGPAVARVREGDPAAEKAHESGRTAPSDPDSDRQAAGDVRGEVPVQSRRVDAVQRSTHSGSSPAQLGPVDRLVEVRCLCPSCRVETAAVLRADGTTPGTSPKTGRHTAAAR